MSSRPSPTRPRTLAIAAMVAWCTGTSLAAQLKVYQAQQGQAVLDGLTMAGFTDGASGRPAAVQTRAAVSYEGDRLHVVVECMEPNMRGLVAKIKPAAKGADAYVFTDDCVEVFISPGKTPKEYYHFAANSLGARFDEKVKSQGWAADWTCEASSGKDRWALRIAIPFEALGGRPQPGAVWAINVSRQRQVSGKLELSSWSPTGQNFHDVSRFGRLVFDGDYATCLAMNVVEPWQRRVAELRKRAQIDAGATPRLAARLGAIHQELQPVLDASSGKVSMERFTGLLSKGEAALAKLDDAAQELNEAVAKLEAIAAMTKLAGPGKKVLTYSVRAITNRKILPTPEPPVSISRVMSIKACRGEYEPASFVAYPLEATVRAEVVATDLKGDRAAIPASAVDIRAVKCWYQSGEGGRFPINRRMKVLTPELLLKDDDLVKVDSEKKDNYVKLSFPDGKTKWLWISSPTTTAEELKVTAEEQPIRDAKTLQPVTIPKHTAKQFWVTIHVPDDARAGKYRGMVELRTGGKLIDSVGLEIEVLPFDLEPNPLESSVYFHWGITLDVTGNGTVRHTKRSVAQYRAELANLLAHGVDNPTLGVRFESGLLGLALWLRHDVGLRDDHLYYLIAGTYRPIEEIKQIIKIAKQFGYEDVYFYGRDEARGEKLKAQRAEWASVRKAGGKVFVAGSQGHNFPELGDVQDLLVCYGDPSKEEAARWHSKGHKIFCYANPQSGIEEPETYRRNFGLLLAANDYDGGMTYIYYHGWNDFHGSRYRQHNFVYPTADGVLDTIQWEGYREGIDDLRYLATLRKAIRAARHAGPTRVRLAGQAQAFLDQLSHMRVTTDLYAIRAEMIRWIRELAATRP